MLRIGWFINEINECGKQVRLCMEDGRLIYGTAKGIIKNNIPGGTLVFLSEGKEMHFTETEMLDVLIDYIHAHDTSKAIIADDYRKLPQKTKKKKQYYRRAENKALRKQAFRLDMIFASLEKTNAGLRELSFC